MFTARPGKEAETDLAGDITQNCSSAGFECPRAGRAESSTQVGGGAGTVRPLHQQQELACGDRCSWVTGFGDDMWNFSSDCLYSLSEIRN